MVLFVFADSQFITFRQLQREHSEVFERGLPVNLDFQVAVKLIEREVDLVLFGRAYFEAELHHDLFSLLAEPASRRVPPARYFTPVSTTTVAMASDGRFYCFRSRAFTPFSAASIIRFTAAIDNPPSSTAGIVAKPIAEAFG